MEAAYSCKLCYLLGCLFAVSGLNESKQESKGFGGFPSRKANLFPAPSLLSFALHPANSHLPASFVPAAAGKPQPCCPAQGPLVLHAGAALRRTWLQRGYGSRKPFACTRGAGGGGRPCSSPSSSKQPKMLAPTLGRLAWRRGDTSPCQHAGLEASTLLNPILAFAFYSSTLSRAVNF